MSLDGTGLTLNHETDLGIASTEGVQGQSPEVKATVASTPALLETSSVKAAGLEFYVPASADVVSFQGNPVTKLPLEVPRTAAEQAPKLVGGSLLVGSSNGETALASFWCFIQSLVTRQPEPATA